MTDIFRKATPGDGVGGIPAEFYNLLVKVAKDFLRRQGIARDGPVELDPTIKLFVKNDSTLALAQFAVVKIGDAVVAPAPPDSSFFGTAVFKSASPFFTSPFAILQLPAGVDDIVPAIASGISLCRLDLVSPTDGYADCLSDVYTHLQSQSEQGPAEILWTGAINSGSGSGSGSTAGDGNVWALVRISSQSEVDYHFGVTLTTISAATATNPGSGLVLVYSIAADGTFTNTGVTISPAYNLCAEIPAGWWVNLHRDPDSKKWIATPRCEKLGWTGPGNASGGGSGSGLIPLTCDVGTFYLPETMCMDLGNWDGSPPGESYGCTALYSQPVTMRYSPELSSAIGGWAWVSDFVTDGTCSLNISLRITCRQFFEPDNGDGLTIQLVGALYYPGIVLDNIQCSTCDWTDPFYVEPGYTLGSFTNLVFHAGDFGVTKYTLTASPCGGGGSGGGGCNTTVSFADADLAIDAATVTITGTGFSPTPSSNTVTFNLGAAGTVTASTTTSLTVTFTTQPTSVGALTVAISAGACSSGAAVQVATVIFGATHGGPTCETAFSMTLGVTEGGNYAFGDETWFYFQPATSEDFHLTITGNGTVTVRHMITSCADQVTLDSTVYTVGGCVTLALTAFETYNVLISAATGDVSLTFNTGVCP